MRSLPLSIFLATAVVALATAARGEGQQKPSDPKAVFNETDTNHDGEIDLEELHVRLVEVFYNADTDKDGFLSVEEYGRLPFSDAFKDADANGDGKVSLHEFVRIRYRQFEEADANHDGALEVDEVITAYEGRKKP